MHSLDSRLKALETDHKNAQILDIGGWFAPCKQATHMVDIMPFETLNTKAAYGYGNGMRIKKENYFQLDLGAVERLPFSDKQFDYVVCRHTLEDIKDPIRICREIMRVGKAGYIETPHRVYESTRGVERRWWCGHYHHRWLVEMEKNKITFQFKPHSLHSSRSFYWRCLPWQKVREEYKNTSLSWDNTFEVEERIILQYSDLKTELKRFKDSFRGHRIKRMRWAHN